MRIGAGAYGSVVLGTGPTGQKVAVKTCHFKDAVSESSELTNLTIPPNLLKEASILVELA